MTDGPMRHRWHYARKGKMAGYVICLRKGCRALGGWHARNQTCRVKRCR